MFVAASCNQQTAIKDTPKPTKTIEAPVFVSTEVETKPETPTPQPNTKSTQKLKVADLVVPKTEIEQDLQIDQNTIKNVEQDTRLDELDNIVKTPAPPIITPAPSISTPIIAPEPTLLPIYSSEDQLMLEKGIYVTESFTNDTLFIALLQCRVRSGDPYPLSRQCNANRNIMTNTYYVTLNGQHYDIYSRGSLDIPIRIDGLTPSTEYPYTITYQESGRLDSVFTRSFITRSE
jgi:hypothetical protein